MTFHGSLVGRHDDLHLLEGFLRDAAADGAALVLTGEAGAGKTSLLDSAAALADAGGAMVLRVTGVQFEANVSFAGLDRLLGPLRGRVEQLPGMSRSALLVALGFGEGRQPDQLVLYNAVLDLLSQVAKDRFVLLVVDDLQWLDSSSAAVVGFVARRVASTRIGVLTAIRSAPERQPAVAGLPELVVRPLDDSAAAVLVASRFPMLGARVHQRVLREARGNPLALLELPAAMSTEQRTGQQALPQVLPLGDRLRALFTARLTAMPAATRSLLLLAALDGSDGVGLMSEEERRTHPDDLAPAERARLIVIDERTGTVRFRHPLVRAAVVQSASAIDRRRAHRRLAGATLGYPDRRAWHLAEATPGPDERVASMLENTARSMLARGDALAAVAALTRAGELSPAPADRTRRTAEAAYFGADVTGDLRNLPHLLAPTEPAELTSSLPAAIAAAYLILNGEGDVDHAHRVLVDAIERHFRDSDSSTDPASAATQDDTMAEALHTLMLVCFFGGRPELWAPFTDAMARFGARVPEALFLSSSMFSDPARMAKPALGRLAAAIGGLRDEVDPAQIVRIGMAAFYVDRLDECRESLWRLVRDGRAGGAVASAINAMMLIAFDDLASGRWDEAQRLASEGIGLCEQHGYLLLAWPGRLALALLSAARGDSAEVTAATGAMVGWSTPRGVRIVLMYAHHARGLDALGRRQYDVAYQELSAISPAGTLAPMTAHSLSVLLDLVEASVRSGRRPQAQAHVAAMREADVAALSPRLAFIVAASAALAAEPGLSAELYEQALVFPGAERWPFERARVELAYGSQLHRGRAPGAAQRHLRSALSTFERLGAMPWISQAAEQLRAAGSPVTGSLGSGPELLTAVELEIATLAGSGLTNRQIGERLYISHRTVGARLYQVFPKLGVTSRSALRDALSGAPR